MSMVISPLIAAGSRFPVGTGEPDWDGELSSIERRSFLLRSAELIQSSPYAAGATPKTTSSYDTTANEESEEFNLPDFAP